MAGRGLGDFLLSELRGLLPPTLFFLVAFNLLALTAWLSGSGASFGFASASLSALVCGKAVLVADNRGFFNRYPARPLMWNVLTKTLLYSALSTVIRLLEHGVHGWLASPRLGSGVEFVLADFSWAHFAMIQLWLAALFLVYTAFGELIGVIGRERMAQLFFGPVGASVA
ncbi:MAG: hypothetical protein ABTQ27_06870 [Amaricoccus sp.]